ncbi:MAG: hypothetical protein WCG75_07595 [Armatimonadota bacterium]
MKSLKFIVIGAIALSATSAFADLKSDWQKVLDKYVALNKKRDIKGFDAMVMKTFTEDFKFTSKDGKQLMTRQQWIDESHQEMKMTGKITKVVFHADSVKMMGKDKALVKVSIVFEGEVQMEPKGKPSKMTSTAKTDQIIVKKGGTWWLQTMTNTEEKMLVNGKPMKGG